MNETMNEQIRPIRQKLFAKLDSSRYEHSLSVSFCCIALAMRYSCDLEKAELAGLLHDAAKRYDDEIILKKCKKKGIEITENEQKALPVLHAIYGEWMAKHKFGVQDDEILSAIRWHTTGRANMSLLEKILFVADFIEPRRSKLPKLDELRRLAFEDIDKAIYFIMEGTLLYLRDKGGFVDPQTVDAFEYYKNLFEERRSIAYESIKGNGKTGCSCTGR